MSIFSLLAARSVSIFETPACANRFFRRRAQRQILVQQLRVVAVRVPARPPRLVEPEPESERVNFLAHGYSFAFCAALVSRRRRRLSAARARFGRGASAPRRRAPTGDDLLRPLRHVHREVRRPLQHAERAAHRRRPHALLRRPLVRVARRHEQPVDVAAEAVLVLRVGNRRAQHLRDVLGDRLARELERRQRLVDVLAADQRRARARPSAPRSGRSARWHAPRIMTRLPSRLPPPRRRAGAGAADRRGLLGHLGRVSLEQPRRRELAELVADHVLGHVDRDELLAVVHRERVPDHLGDHRRSARPGLDDLLVGRRGSSPRSSRAAGVSTNGTLLQ